MNQQSIALLRLAAQRLVNPFDKPEDAVKHLLAMQSQDYNGALWSIGVRTKVPAKSMVERAISDRTIVRTWPMRGTLHFLHAADVHWMLELLAPRATAAAKGRRITQLGLTDDIVADAERILRGALKGGKSIKRGDVVELLQAVKGLTIDNQHTQHLMRHFGERGVICFGPNEGKQPTFVLLDEWIARPSQKPREVALIELARRYFIGHGPATLKDFAGWGMLTMGDARFGLNGALPDLAVAEIDGTPVFSAKGLSPAPAGTAMLLSGFDEYVLGYKDRAAVLPVEYASKIVPGNNGMFLSTVIEDGVVVGLWRRTVKASGITHQYESFTPFTSDLSAAETTYDQYLNS